MRELSRLSAWCGLHRSHGVARNYTADGLRSGKRALRRVGVPLDRATVGGPVLRLWRDTAQLLAGALPGPSDQYIDIPRDALPDLLRSVQQDLIGFLVALRQWAQDVVPDLADRLVIAVDRRLQISALLEI